MGVEKSLAAYKIQSWYKKVKSIQQPGKFVRFRLPKNIGKEIGIRIDMNITIADLHVRLATTLNEKRLFPGGFLCSSF